jgi:hypothetical protein
MYALPKSETKSNQHERKLRIHLLNLFEANRYKILNVFYDKYIKAIIKTGTFTNIKVSFTLEDFKEEDRAGLFITQKTLADFGPVAMIDTIGNAMIKGECMNIKLLLERSGFPCGTVSGGFSNNGGNGDYKYAYIYGIG